MTFIESVVLIDGSSAKPKVGPYVNTPLALSGGRIGLFIVWRLPESETSGGHVVNIGIDYAMFSPDSLYAELCDGIRIRIPITPSVSPRVAAVGPGRGLMNQCGGALRGADIPVCVSIWSDHNGVPQYYFMTLINNDWICCQISKFTTEFVIDGPGTISIPHSRPQIAFFNERDGICIFRSAEFSNMLMGIVICVNDDEPNVKLVCLLNHDLGSYEPIIDHESSKKGVLRVYIQSCGQVPGDMQMADSASSEATIFEWNAEDICRYGLSNSVRLAWSALQRLWIT
jgi:hypothetical protein